MGTVNACYVENRLWDQFDPDKHWFANHDVIQEFFPTEWRKAARSFPSWVPTEALIECLEVHDSLAMPWEDERLKQQAAVYRQLCTHPNMETVWRRLYRRDKCLETTGNYSALMYSVFLALHDKNPWDDLTVLQRKKLNAELISAARDLADKLKIFGGITISKAALPKALRLAADDLEAFPPYRDALLKTATKNDRLTILVRSLALEFQQDYGTPLLENVALIAGIFFPNEISPQRVKVMVEGIPEEAKYFLAKG